MREISDNLYEFLVTSHFGVDLQNCADDKEVIKGCVFRAFRDLSRRVPYKYSVTQLAEMKKTENLEEAKKFNALWKNNEEFTYGLSQKWVNMTFKYLYLLGKCSIQNDKLDVPIDSYIIRAANASEDDNYYGLDINWGKSLVWSKLNDKEYKEFQERIENKIKEKDYKTKIDWECKAWIEQAKIEAQ